MSTKSMFIALMIFTLLMSLHGKFIQLKLNSYNYWFSSLSYWIQWWINSRTTFELRW